MSYTMTISPDFKPDLISGWYIFNTWLQKQSDIAIHLNLVNDFSELAQCIDKDSIDLIYANPCDIAKLIREKSFEALVKPVGVHDETVVITHADNPIDTIESLKPSLRVAMTDVPDVNTMGTIMLEPADINSCDIEAIICSNYITVAKKVVAGEADIGFLLADAYNEFSSLVKKQVKPLITSKIDVLHHALLLGPNLQDKKSLLQKCLIMMADDTKGMALLNSMEIEKWEIMEQDEAEFLIDLIDTLSPS